MNWQKFVGAEMWKKSAILGWFGYVVLMLVWAASAIVAMAKGCNADGVCRQPIELGTTVVFLVTSVLGIGQAGQWIKRATEWTPTEHARAAQIKNGGKAGGGNYGNGE